MHASILLQKYGHAMEIEEVDSAAELHSALINAQKVHQQKEAINAKAMQTKKSRFAARSPSVVKLSDPVLDNIDPNIAFDFNSNDIEMP